MLTKSMRRANSLVQNAATNGAGDFRGLVPQTATATCRYRDLLGYVGPDARWRAVISAFDDVSAARVCAEYNIVAYCTRGISLTPICLTVAHRTPETAGLPRHSPLCSHANLEIAARRISTDIPASSANCVRRQIRSTRASRSSWSAIRLSL